MTTVDETLLTQAALDGELDAADMLDFENRLAGNTPLAAEYSRLKTLRKVMRRELVKPVAPQALRERVARMAAPSIAPRATRAAPPWRAMAASAVLAAGLGSASTWLALRTSIQYTNLADTSFPITNAGFFLASPSISHLPIVTRLNRGSRHASRWRQRWWTLHRKDFRSPAAGSTSSPRTHAGPDLPAQRAFYQPDRLARASRATPPGGRHRRLFR